MNKKIILIPLIIIILFACESKVIEKDSYLIGIVSNEIYPFGFKDKKIGKFLGFEYDLMTEIAKRSDLKFSFSEYSFLSMMSKIKKQEIDMGIGIISIIETRKKIMKFSKPYMTSQVVVLGNKENKFINENKIMYGFTKGTYFKKLIDYKENIDFLEKIDTEEVIRELILNNIDYAIVDKKLADGYRKKYSLLYEKEVLKKDFVGIAFSNNLPNSFIDKVNNIILEMEQDGFLDNLKRKYDINIEK